MSSKSRFQGGRVHEQLLNAMCCQLGKSLDDCTSGGYIMEILDLYVTYFLSVLVRVGLGGSLP